MITKIYYLIFFITVAKSIIILRRTCFPSQNYFFVFLIINFFVDFLSEVNIITSKAIQYNYLNVFNMLFFIFFYYKRFKNKFIVYLSFLALVSCIFYTHHFFYFDKYILSLGILYCTTNIIYSLYWINLKFNNVSESSITNDPIFWISTALLIWSCLFLFRIIPMYFLDEEDKQFLKLLKDILSLVNILVYILFYIGISKYKHI